MLGFGNKEKSKGVDYVEQKYGVKPRDFASATYDLLFSVYDVVQNCYMPPFISPTVAGAKRAMSEVANDTKSLLNKYPDDYVLYQVGYFEKTTGIIAGCPTDTPARVCVLSELIKKGE
nr:DNA binding protein [Microvirus sp.]